MSKNNFLIWLLAGGLSLNTLSCQVNKEITAPPSFLPTGPVKVAKEAYGGWIEANLEESWVLPSVKGELITVHEDTVYILSPAQLNAVPVSAMKEAKLELHLQNTSGFTKWAAAGAVFLSSSHGWFLLFSLPVWVISGIAVSSSAAHQPNVIHFPATGLDEFKKFSRFPQGLPASLDPGKLEPKPLKR